MPLQAILFDAVGTLFRAEPEIATVYTSAGAAFGLQLTREQVSSRFREAYRQVFAPHDIQQRSADHQHDRRRWQAVVQQVFRELEDTEPLFQTLWNHFASPTAWQLFADVPAAWQEVRRRGLLVGIASNYDHRLLEVIAGHALLADCPHLFHSAGLGHAKPAPRFFREIEQKLQLPPREILLVGDDWENDYQGAIGAGWQAVYLDRSGKSERNEAIRGLDQLGERMSDL